jgi:hypothetical protein
MRVFALIFYGPPHRSSQLYIVALCQQLAHALVELRDE